MKNLEEIDEEFKSLLDIESDKLKFKLGDLKNRAKFGNYNQEFKKKVSWLIKKKEKEINHFVSKHKDRLFPSEDTKEEIEKPGPRYLDVKHLNLKLTRREKASVRRSIKKFKFKLWWNNIYYYLVPSWIFFRLFKIRFKISNFFSDLGRSFGYFFRRLSKKLLDFFNGVGLGIKSLDNKFAVLWNDFFELFTRKKKEGEDKKGEKKEEKSAEGNEVGGEKGLEEKNVEEEVKEEKVGDK